MKSIKFFLLIALMGVMSSLALPMMTIPFSPLPCSISRCFSASNRRPAAATGGCNRVDLGSEDREVERKNGGSASCFSPNSATAVRAPSCSACDSHHADPTLCATNPSRPGAGSSESRSSAASGKQRRPGSSEDSADADRRQACGDGSSVILQSSAAATTIHNGPVLPGLAVSAA